MAMRPDGAGSGSTESLLPARDWVANGFTFFLTVKQLPRYNFLQWLS